MIRSSYASWSQTKVSILGHSISRHTPSNFVRQTTSRRSTILVTCLKFCEAGKSTDILTDTEVSPPEAHNNACRTARKNSGTAQTANFIRGTMGGNENASHQLVIRGYCSSRKWGHWYARTSMWLIQTSVWFTHIISRPGKIGKTGVEYFDTGRAAKDARVGVTASFSGMPIKT